MKVEAEVVIQRRQKARVVSGLGSLGKQGDDKEAGDRKFLRKNRRHNSLISGLARGIKCGRCEIHCSVYAGWALGPVIEYFFLMQGPGFTLKSKL